LSDIGTMRILPVAVQNLVAASMGASSGATAPRVAATTAGGSPDRTSEGTGKDELTVLLEALCVGDLGAARASFSRLTGEPEDEAGEDSTFGGAPGDAEPDQEDEGDGESEPKQGARQVTVAQPAATLDDLIRRVGASLQAERTDAALMELTDFLVLTGRGRGNLLNIAA
jgi:hypothetical protein